MFDTLTLDPEWTETNYDDIHVRQFNGLTGFNLPACFDPEVAMPIDYFQLFFLMKSCKPFVTIPINLKFSMLHRNEQSIQNTQKIIGSKQH